MEIKAFGIVDAESRDLLPYCCLHHVWREISRLRFASLEMTERRGDSGVMCGVRCQGSASDPRNDSGTCRFIPIL